MSPRRRKLLTILAVAVGALALLLAGVLVAFRMLLARAPEYRGRVEAWVSQHTELHIDFARMDARWRYYGPELTFDQAVVMSRDRARTYVSARRVSVAYDIWAAILTFRLAAGRVTVEGPELQIVRTEAGKFEIVGQHALPDRDPSQPFEPDALPTGRLRIADARVSFRDLKSRRGPWIVPGVSFDLRRAGAAMSIEGEVRLPANLGRSLRFDAQTEGRLERAAELEWRFSVDARNIDLGGWAELGPADSLAPSQGRGSFKLFGAFRGADVDDLTMQARFERLTLALPAWSTPLPSEAQLLNQGSEETQAAPSEDAPKTAVRARDKASYDAVAFDLTLLHRRAEEREQWNVRVKDLELSQAGKLWRNSVVRVNVTRERLASGAASLTVEAQADHLALQNLWPLLAYMPEGATLARVRAVAASGDVRGLDVRFARSDDVSYAVQAELRDVSFKAIGKAPGFDNLSGSVSASENVGRFALDVRNGALALPRTFRTPLPVERLTGALEWRRETGGWRVTANGVEIDSIDGHARASADVFVPADGGSPIVDAKASANDLNATAAPRYMPAGQMGQNVLAWLDRAFPAGRVPEASFEMRGPTRAFPFRNEEGLFLIKARIEDLTLDYQPGWAPAVGVTAEAEFRNAGMTATASGGNVAGVQIKSATARFVDFKTAELLLEADAEGDLSSALTYLQKSPVGPALGGVFMALHGQGALSSTLQLRLPVKEVDKRKLTVESTLMDATIGLAGWSQEATHMNGKIVVQDHTIGALSLKGELLNGPLTATGGADGRYTGPGAGVVVNAQGRAMGAQVADLLQLPRSIALSGGTTWQMRMRIPRRAPETPARLVVTVNSDSKGLGVELPQPIGKRAEQARDLRLDFETGDVNDALLVRGAFGQARALARLLRVDDAWRFDRAGVRVDGVAASLPAHEGLRIEGAIERFVLDDWLKIKSDRSGGKPLADYLRAANVRVGQFGLYGYAWSDVRAIMQPGEGQWRVDVAADGIAGQLFIPYNFNDTATLELNLTALDIGKRSGGEADQQADPRELPALRGRVDALRLSGRAAGALRFAVDKTPQGVRLSSFELRGDSFTANAHGAWQFGAGGQAGKASWPTRSSLTLDVASNDVRQTLSVFDYRDLVAGKRANMHLNLRWPGGLDEEFLARASGSIHLDIVDGQLLGVEPGAGRVLGLMSVAALPRRLSFDFSDVTDKGLSFDSVRGDFELHDGDAYTNNLLVRGPAGEVGIVGRTGFGKRDYDLTAVVAGDIGGSLSVASTVVGGPVVGAAVLAFTRLFKEPLKGVSRRYYRIEGPWEGYRYERIDKQEAQQTESATAGAIEQLNQEQTEEQAAEQTDAAAAPPEDSPPRN